MDGLTQWLKLGRVTEGLKVSKNTDAWKVMIAYAKEHCTCSIDVNYV